MALDGGGVKMQKALCLGASHRTQRPYGHWECSFRAVEGCLLWSWDGSWGLHIIETSLEETCRSMRLRWSQVYFPIS